MFSFLLINIADFFPPAKKFTSIADFANILIPNLFLGAGIIFFIMIIMAGLSILKAGGNPEELKKAQKLLTYSTIGFTIILSSYLLVKLICEIFKITCFGI